MLSKRRFPFGSKMPGRSITASTFYKLGYQSQPEEAEMGGYNSFELRLYDARIGGWLSPDPYNQHHSPYMAMSSNPLSFIDPDGGYDYWNGETGGFSDAATGYGFIGDGYEYGSDGQRIAYRQSTLDWMNRKPRMGGLSAAFENFDAARTYYNSIENTTIRQVTTTTTKTAKFYTAFSLTRGLVDPVYINYEISSTVIEVIKSGWEGFTNWWDNSEFYFNAGGKIDIGVQAGLKASALGAEVGIDGRIVSFDLLGVSVEQVETTEHPYVWNYDYIGEDGSVNVTQHFGASLIGGISGTHSFQAGDHIRNQQVSGGVEAGILSGQYNYNPMTGVSTKDANISLGGRAALIIGIEGSLTVGFRDK